MRRVNLHHVQIKIANIVMKLINAVIADHISGLKMTKSVFPNVHKNFKVKKGNALNVLKIVYNAMGKIV